MKANLGILGLSVVAVGIAGAVYAARPARPQLASATPAALAAAVPERSPAPAPSVSPAAPAATTATNVDVTRRPTQVTTVATQAAAKSAPIEPAAIPERPASSERPRSTEPVSAPEPIAPPAPAPTAPEPQKPRFDEVTVATDSVLGVTIDSTISSETARVEDLVNARVSRDVLVDGKVAIPAGARLEGVVTDVTRGGKFKERPRVGVTFQTLILADGTKIALATDTVFREGEPPANVNAKVAGSGVVGAILGAMIGGKKGAVLGSAAGAGAGAAAVAAGERAEVKLISGSSLTVRLKQPITVLVERHHENAISSR